MFNDRLYIAIVSVSGSCVRGRVRSARHIRRFRFRHAAQCIRSREEGRPSVGRSYGFVRQSLGRRRLGRRV